ncbi:MAG TPA: hypothetical protein VGE26_05725, partial [Sphingobacteriaceae bacterium]
MLTGNDIFAVFRALPVAGTILRPDAPRFTIAEVNDEYLRLSGREREGLEGRGLFEAFPQNPDDREATGLQHLREALLGVITKGKPCHLPALRY